MATDTFTWCVRTGANEQISKSVYQAKFGDGYEQVAENGINSDQETWPLTCSGNLEDMRPVGRQTPQVRLAVIASEDQLFPDHHGFAVADHEFQ